MDLRTLLYCFALALGGCATLTWQKDGADPATTAHDLDQCQQNAMVSVRRLGSAMGNTAPVIVGSPSGPVGVVMPSQNPAQDPVAMQSQLSQCMRERGYRLVRER